MIAAFDDDGGTYAVCNHSNRHSGNAPGILMWRVRYHHEADLLSGSIEVNCSEGAGRPDCRRTCHGNSSKGQIGVDQSSGERRACATRSAMTVKSRSPLSALAVLASPMTP